MSVKINIRVYNSVYGNAALTITDTFGNTITLDEVNDIRFVDLFVAIETLQSGPFFKVSRTDKSIAFESQFDNVPPYQTRIIVTTKQYEDFLASILFVEKTLYGEKISI